MTRRINRLEASDSLLTTASKAASAASAGVRWWGWLHGGILGMGSITGGGIGAGLRGQRRLHLKLSQRVALRPPRSSTPRPPDSHPAVQSVLLPQEAPSLRAPEHLGVSAGATRPLHQSYRSNSGLDARTGSRGGMLWSYAS
ncbi:uncharacterized protein BO87DRAFT_166260 [Aspergillus neoniger CBS 115656]|uniref:Uncharacterized protein n=1 Tax=Aspergillus neoniger (strain CBS 115656) TaxID=1448310 RepID=A0A318YVQ5_ASPNB|nr:hypothetical protein BO87DRAFT_166260 [Aspergillus neoniger CBS 115656]PYH38334.1 hypothetical protein BO87DRAFT_166260 [Aspergillus neoniger CBS 115656]